MMKKQFQRQQGKGGKYGYSKSLQDKGTVQMTGKAMLPMGNN